MIIIEESIERETLAHIENAAGKGAKLVGISIDAPPLEIVEAIDQFVDSLPKKRWGKVDSWTDLALPLGSLWGYQIVRAFEWEWSSVTFHDHGESRALGVFAEDRSLAVYPWHFLFGCLEYGAPVTILLAFQMLAVGEIAPQEPNAYVNLMEEVHEIVPAG